MSSADGGLLAALIGALYFMAAVAASVHTILYKHDSRAAVAWVGVIWLVPLGGPLLYLTFGINRIRRRATELRGDLPRIHTQPTLHQHESARSEPQLPDYLQSLARLSDVVSHQPLLAGNRLTPLLNGDAAYPRMLEAIEQARHTITLSTYIFNNDPIGRDFVHALARAVERGVAVRVLVDAVGLRYSFPSIIRRFRQHRIPYARFMPTRTPLGMPFLNLRNHRKMLVVDGELGFTGGMNIAAGNCVASAPRHPIRDIHFMVEGPVVSELQAVFVQDWHFACREWLEGPAWFPEPQAVGESLARVVLDGPDESFDTLRQLFAGALSVARSHVRIVTPYFLPDLPLQDALKTAALRGVRVDVVLPQRNNLPVVDWACRGQLESLLQWGVRVWFSPREFDHSKLFTLDGHWSMIGSANWDPRSLSLNFECNLECYDAVLTSHLEALIDQRLAQSREHTLACHQAISLPGKLRNGMARLFSPYL